jgi:hypothetical protein
LPDAARSVPDRRRRPSGTGDGYLPTGRNDRLAFRFGYDAGVGAMLYLAIAVWPMGEVDRATSLVESARARIGSVSHVGSKAYAAMHPAMFELMGGDVARVAANANQLVRLADEHDLSLWRAFAAFLQGWLAAQGGEADAKHYD